MTTRSGIPKKDEISWIILGKTLSPSISQIRSRPRRAQRLQKASWLGDNLYVYLDNVEVEQVSDPLSFYVVQADVKVVTELRAHRGASFV